MSSGITFCTTTTPTTTNHGAFLTRQSSRHRLAGHSLLSRSRFRPITAAALAQKAALQYRKLGDSDLEISEITIGTVEYTPSGKSVPSEFKKNPPVNHFLNRKYLRVVNSGVSDDIRGAEHGERSSRDSQLCI
ncbi:hypothetical protein LINPERPRIM_LOCUS22521 [Linum perenne]